MVAPSKLEVILDVFSRSGLPMKTEKSIPQRTARPGAKFLVAGINAGTRKKAAARERKEICFNINIPVIFVLQ